MDDSASSKGKTDKTGASSYSVRQDSDEEGVNITDYINVILKNRKTIVLICGFVVIVTAIISLLLPKSYSATVAIVPPVDIMQKESSLMSGLGAVKNPVLQKVLDVSSITDIYVGILQSRSVANALIERYDLAKVYHISKYVSDVRKKLAERTSIEVSKKGIISISVEDRDPCRAADIANSYVDELDRRNKQLFVGQATNKKIFLENRLKEVEKDLSGIENLLSRDAKIKEMLFEMLTREYEIAKIEEAKTMPTIQFLDKAEVPEKKCRPKRTQMVLLAGIVSLFSSIFVVCVRERLTLASSR